MKNLRTILFYLNKDNEEVVTSLKEDKILFDKFNALAKDTITVRTRTMLANKEFDKLTKYLENLDKKYQNDISIEDKLFTIVEI